MVAGSVVEDLSFEAFPDGSAIADCFDDGFSKSIPLSFVEMDFGTHSQRSCILSSSSDWREEQRLGQQLQWQNVEHVASLLFISWAAHARIETVAASVNQQEK